MTRHLERSGVIARIALSIAFVTGAGAVAQAETDGAPAPIVIPGVPTEGEQTTRPGELDSLLKLPSGYNAAPAAGRIVAGAGESEWRRRFDRAQDKLDGAVQALEATKRELDEVAGTGGGSQWAVAPPGVSSPGAATNSPLSFKLRQDLLRRREALDEAERGMKELRIEADLAGVPVAWRGDEYKPIPRRIPEDPR